MDKLKKQLAPILKFQFWILSGLILIASVAVFALTAMGIAKDFAARMTAIDGKYAEVSTVSGKVSKHPNSDSHKRMEELLKVLEKDVEQAWKMQYGLQAGLMDWPSGAFFSEQMADVFRSLRPVEKFVEFPIANLSKELQLVSERDRRVYRDYIGPTFKEKSKIIGTEWKARMEAIKPPAGMGGGGMGGSMMMGPGMEMGDSSDSGGSMLGGSMLGGSMGSESSLGMMGGSMLGPGMGGSGSPMVNNDIVKWSVSSQQALLNQIAPWYSPSKLPTILDIYYTQEDIWLLTNIMEIIKRTNGNAKEHFQAVVKEIEFIRMGKFANRDAGTIMPSTKASSGFGSMMSGEGSSGAEGSSSMSAGMESDSSGSEYGASADAAQVDPADNRYISFAPETFFLPRKGAEIRESIKNIRPENAVDAVAKRIPIRIRVKIEASKIHRLITECGNAPLMLEVFQVRLATTAAPEKTVGGSGGGMMMGGEIGGMMGGGSMMSDYSSSSDMGSSSMMGMDNSSSGYPGAGGMLGAGMSGIPGMQNMASLGPEEKIIPIEIFGLIYLYNPYDKASLGENQVADEPAANANTPDTATDGSAPAASASAPSGDGTLPNAGDVTSEPNVDNAQPTQNGEAGNGTPGEDTSSSPQTPPGADPSAVGSGDTTDGENPPNPSPPETATGEPPTEPEAGGQPPTNGGNN